MKKIDLTATEEVQGFRIDKAVSVLCEELSRSAVQNLLEEKKISLNGAIAKKSQSVKAGDVLTVESRSQKSYP